MNKTIAILMAALITAMGIPSAIAPGTIGNEAVQGITNVCNPSTIGIEITQTSINFGYLYPGETSEEQNVNVDIIKTPDVGCIGEEVEVELSIDGGDWNGAVGISTIISTPIATPIILSSGILNGYSAAGVQASLLPDILPGIYTTSITVTGTY